MEDNIRENIVMVSFLKKLRSDWKRYLIVFTVSTVIAILLIMPIPRYYKCELSLAPEMDNADNGGKLSSIASTFGVDLGDAASANALQPSLYPDLMESNVFVKSLLRIPVMTKDQRVKTTYYDYLQHYQKLSPYDKIFGWLEKKVNSKDSVVNSTDSINPFMLSKAQDDIFSKIKKSIKCDIDIKTGLITISVEDQDPLISAVIADSVRAKLQDFISNYKTTKARNDVKYYAKLVAEAKAKYEKARQKYAAFSDANQDVVLQELQSQRDEMENDMQLKFNAYSALITQLQNAQAKVQEHTPSFTIVQSASVPVKPAGPKRMAFVFIVVFISLLVTFVVCNFSLLFGGVKADS